ncbi:MAG: NTP transferase domain-containing protein [Planctomycetota bacterium]
MAARDDRPAGVVAVIPARHGSTRLPRKALLNDTGKFLVQHVWERVRSVAAIARVIIATDHEHIERAARSFGAEVMIPRPRTDPVPTACEVARRIDARLIVNVQGDEPEVDVGGLQAIAQALEQDARLPRSPARSTTRACS